MALRRVFLIVIDALGVGALPDAPAYGDALSVNTLGNIDKTASHLRLPTLEKLGLGHLLSLKQVKPHPQPTGWVSKLAEASCGKDTTTGHWEMAGVILNEPFPTYPDGFRDELVQAFCAQAGVEGVLGNKPASGTTILEELGEQHLQTGWPILYTSADSVWQLAAHVDKVPLETLYHWCELSRALLRGPDEVSRVIARPFEGKPGAFKRIGSARHDYAVAPPEDTLLSRLVAQPNTAVVGVGKIKDIFCGAGITHHWATQDNAHGLEVMEQLAKTGGVNAEDLQEKPQSQLVFVNLVETDMNYGHRRDVEGYAQALEAVDAGLARFLPHLTAEDLLLITGDHGCDPTAPGSDHTREYVPLVLYSPAIEGPEPGNSARLADRTTFADLAQTTLEWLGVEGEGLPGTSVLGALSA